MWLRTCGTGETAEARLAGLKDNLCWNSKGRGVTEDSLKNQPSSPRTEESVRPMSGNPANEAELQALRVAELRDLCKTNGLEHKGLKAELQERLREHLFKGPSVAGGEVSVSAVSGGGSGSPREGMRPGERRRSRLHSVVMERWAPCCYGLCPASTIARLTA